jgi:hypothetical protein
MGATVFYAGASELATLSNVFSVLTVPTDPTTVTLVVTDPLDVSTTYTYAAAQITRTGTGAYSKDIACTLDGIWHYTWTGTGTATDVTAGTWTVFPTELQQRYCTVEQLKSRLTISDALDDFEIGLAIDTATAAIDDICQRRFWRGTDTRTYTANSYYEVQVDDLVSVTSLKTGSGDGTFPLTWAVTDYQLHPVNPNTGTGTVPYTSIRAVGANIFPPPTLRPGRTDLVQVVGVWGWPQIPPPVNQAALIMAADFLASGGAPFGIAGFGDFAVRIRGNPRAEALLAPFRKYSMLVA